MPDIDDFWAMDDEELATPEGFQYVSLLICGDTIKKVHRRHSDYEVVHGDYSGITVINSGNMWERINAASDYEQRFIEYPTRGSQNETIRQQEIQQQAAIYNHYLQNQFINTHINPSFYGSNELADVEIVNPRITRNNNTDYTLPQGMPPSLRNVFASGF